MNSLRIKFSAFLFALYGMTLLRAQEATEAIEENVAPQDNAWLINACSVIKNSSISAWEGLCAFVSKLLFQDLGMREANPVTLIILLVILSIMLASGAWAASIAQMRRHSGLKFFFLGFFTFFVGPVRMLYLLDVKGEKEKLELIAQEAARKREEEARRKALEEQQSRERGEIQSPKVSADGVTWNQEYFESIRFNEDGTPGGPWDVAYNGVEITVTEIVEVQQNFVQAKMINLEGNPMVGRIPFARLEKWELKK